ncbi:uncharacterized protein LOC111789434 isoform X2 [Cucurbita pepo subsp. pepo]|uniref:uncharacterized protein LOC111789434 isoform X2 n=1 Tax=Cucurbita pepo subsp. pepo TaxID=3664 RepID=UPI000C9D59ED|nr:uncharacterized protein LOC111789434 isoform X2 [Cucurbita pepo subsp. pepo]
MHFLFRFYITGEMPNSASFLFSSISNFTVCTNFDDLFRSQISWARSGDYIISVGHDQLVIRLKTGVEMKVLTPLKPFPMQFLTFLLNLPLNINWHGIHFGQSRTNFMMIMGMSYFLYVVISWGSLLLHPVSQVFGMKANGEE